MTESIQIAKTQFPRLLGTYIPVGWAMEECGYVDLRDSAELPLFKRLRGVSALQALSGSALPHAGCTQHPAAATAAGPILDQHLQALGTNLAKHCWLGL